MGAVDQWILQWLGKEMGDCLAATVKSMPAIPVPPGSYEAGRNQYYSTRILKAMLKEVPEDAEKLLGVTDKDLCIPILTYVFGEAQLGGTAAVVSLARLRQEHYGLAPDRELFQERIRKECLHELGHTFGLNDMYDASYADHTMYGYGSRGETKKNTLTAGDAASVNALY